jgi:pimeloyl-ACP methyl ester carboxylesterase
MTTLLIPGTQATFLEDQNEVIVYNAVRVEVGLQKNELGNRPISEWAQLLSMAHTEGEIEPSRTTLEPGSELTAGAVVVTPYQLFPHAYVEWSYDWRADLRFNAIRLLAELRKRHAAGEGRSNLIGHSQGGLLIVLASKRADPGEFARLVARVVLVGAPLAGTMRAVEALVFGHPSLGKDQRLVARQMARTWPAIYQMLPAWPCVVDEHGTTLPEGEQLLSLTGWPAGEADAVSEDMLSRARKTQVLLHDPFSNFGVGVRVWVVMGVNKDTGRTLVKQDGKFVSISMDKKAGDSLTHYAETLKWGGSSFAFTVVPYAGGVEAHAMLCADETVAEHIKHFLSVPVPEPVGV